MYKTMKDLKNDFEFKWELIACNHQLAEVRLKDLSSKLLAELKETSAGSRQENGIFIFQF